MSQLSLPDLKAYLRVVHNADDAMLTRLLRSAEAQAMRFLGTRTLLVQPILWETTTTTTDMTIPEDVETAVFLMVRADYEAAEPAHAAAWKDCAAEMLWPYRQGAGV